MTTTIGGPEPGSAAPPDAGAPAERPGGGRADRARRQARRQLVWLVPLAMVCVAFLAFTLPPYATFDPEQARFPIREDFPPHYPLMVAHIMAGAVMLLITCAQVSPWVRRHHPAVHRWSGRVYVFAGVPLMGLPGLVIAPLSHTGFSTQVSNTLWALLWLGTTVAGYRMARARRYADHREWMLRSFALLWAIVLNRPWAFVCVMVLMPQLETTFGGQEALMIQQAASASSWLSWVTVLIVVELWIQRSRGRRGPARRAAANATAAG
ncbi:DUF2306 domain-containing protein [Allonocardiopsis opalescens]|uniref:Putative membrane protein DUF2306 n=1 Tax=Allonocardiopsis opalescens TaxID=1144618 RepID=A0A2T0Q203_9ACTN|nr:DUF2306 domain-containing protein [Allonocardiopsis opalescens]PRX97823.1 putative membrane protein DUF2306 [Allonocardiopsis opalescens]